MADLKQLSNTDESNVRSITRGRDPAYVRGDHREGHSEGQNAARGCSLGLVTAGVS
jgi:hypothetical protein